MKTFIAGFALGSLLAGATYTLTPQAAPRPDAEELPRATGIGGVFFLAENPKAMTAWYRENLGLSSTYGATTVFEWRELDQPDRIAQTVWGPFSKTTTYFRKPGAQWMVNFRVRKLDALLGALREKGIRVEEKIETYDYGRFAWIYDPEGNRVELWEPSDIPAPKSPVTEKKP